MLACDVPISAALAGLIHGDLFLAGRFRLLTLIVLTGGVALLARVLLIGSASKGIAFALVMEWVVTPSLAIWQNALRNAHENSVVRL